MARKERRFNVRTLMAVLAALLFFSGGIMPQTSQARTLTIVAFGDSLTAGWGMRRDEAFPAVLEQELRRRGLDVTVVNFGVSGDTTAGGVARLDAAIAARPDGVILELGANDGLRGFDPALVEANMERIITRFKAAGVPVLLTGMRALVGMGKAYGEEFRGIFPRLAEKHGLPLYPFFLEGVAGDPKLNLPDGLHPNPEGVREIVRRIAPEVEAFVRGIMQRQ